MHLRERCVGAVDSAVLRQVDEVIRRRLCAIDNLLDEHVALVLERQLEAIRRLYDRLLYTTLFVVGEEAKSYIRDERNKQFLQKRYLHSSATSPAVLSAKVTAEGVSKYSPSSHVIFFTERCVYGGGRELEMKRRKRFCGRSYLQ